MSSRDVYAGVAGVSVFRRVGVREKIASDRGAWRDTMILERQSRRVGLP